MNDEFISGFIEEVKELLFQLEDDLINLEKNPGNAEIINNIFRVMHTLKGSAGMVGFRNIQDITHEFENVYERIREGDLKVDSDIIDVTLKAKDLILSMLEGNANENQEKELITLIREKNNNNSKVKKKTSQNLLSNDGNQFLVIFAPEKSVFERGLDPDKIIKEISSKNGAYILLHEKKKSWESQKAEKVCFTVWEIYLKTFLTISEIEEIFLFYDAEEYNLFELSMDSFQIDPILASKLSKIYKSKIKIEEHIKKCIANLPELKREIPPETQTSVLEQKSPEIQKFESDSTINVSSHKLDELMNLVSELVTLTATVEVHARKFNDPKLGNSLESVEKLTKKFRNNALDLRLVPVGSLLTKFKRQVRDLSKDLNKNVNLIIEGQDIEIDKTILKSIESPLQHIIRNSIDHGLEQEEERLAKSKTKEGLLKISAFYSGASVIIQVQDDGRGINLERVRECAIKKGLIQPDQTPTKQELLNMIMEPGFTTNENISIVSGRGVGMDVVRKELNTVGGSLEIFTEKDLGTSITMKLPTTLTIIDTLMVEVAQTQILIPIMDIEYCFKEENKSLFEKDNKYVQYKNNPIPLVSLHEQFNYSASELDDLMVIVINKFDRKYAITADQIIGEHQAVIKPLGDLFRNQPFFSGGSIMVDGKLAFILDTNFLFNHVTKI